VITDIRNLIATFQFLGLSEPTERVRRVFAKLSCGWALSSRLTPAAIRPNERSESAFRAAANAVSAAAVTPRCLAQGVQRCFQPIIGFVIAERSIIRHASIHPFHLGPIPTSVLATQEDREHRIQADWRNSSTAVSKAQCPEPSTADARAFNPSEGGRRVASSQYRSVRMRMPVFSG
jgi:hypothetical protein